MMQGLMDTRLTKEEGPMGLSYYRLGLNQTSIYLQEDGFFGVSVVAAPLIHAYAPSFFHCTQLALGKIHEEKIQFDGENYQVENFLVVQKLHDGFTEESPDVVQKFTPTVKPHYVFETNEKKVFSDYCPTAIYVDGHNFCKDELSIQNVICHDGTVSPNIRVDLLANGIEQAMQHGKNYCATSYVISPKTKRILITQHCLLNDSVHDQF